MEDILLTAIFVMAISAPMMVFEAIEKHKQNKKPTVIGVNRASNLNDYITSPGLKRHRYDTVFNWFYQEYAKQLAFDGVNVPDFMNRELIKKAHEKAVYIAQSGKLNKVYRQIQRLNNEY